LGQFRRVDKWPKTNPQIAANSRQAPALHADEDVTITTSAEPMHGRGNERGADAALAVIRSDEQVAHFAAPPGNKSELRPGYVPR
jgi:hypothetical protein